MGGKEREKEGEREETKEGTILKLKWRIMITQINENTKKIKSEVKNKIK